MRFVKRWHIGHRFGLLGTIPIPAPILWYLTLPLPKEDLYVNQLDQSHHPIRTTVIGPGMCL